MSATDREVTDLHRLSSAAPGHCPFDAEGACPVCEVQTAVAITESNRIAKESVGVSGDSAATSVAAEPATEERDGAVEEAAAVLAETSMDELDYSDISDAEEPVEPMRLAVADSVVVAGTLRPLPRIPSVLGELAQPIPLREADLLAVVRLTSSLEVETAAESLVRNYDTDYDVGMLTALITGMINARRDLAGRLLEQMAELRATGASAEELLTAFANVLLQLRMEHASH